MSRNFQVIHPVVAIKPERLVVGQLEFQALKLQIVISSWGGMRRAIQVCKAETQKLRR
jgi:hypothetical protein